MTISYSSFAGNFNFLDKVKLNSDSFFGKVCPNGEILSIQGWNLYKVSFFNIKGNNEDCPSSSVISGDDMKKVL
jgi:hypothetical protein